jgi:DNA-binding transcriptional LysR family regulator
MDTNKEGARELARGERYAVRMPDDRWPPFAGYLLYYPSRRQQRPALSALIETLRL